MGDIVSWWKSKDGIFAQVEALVIFSTLLFAIQVVFGWWRRCSSNVFIKYSVWLAYTLTPLVPIYTLGLISSFIYSEHNLTDLPDDGVDSLFVWSISLVGFLGSTFSLTAYDVDDNKRYIRHLIRHALCMIYTVAIARLFIYNKIWRTGGEAKAKTSPTFYYISNTLSWTFSISSSLLFWPKSILSTFTGIMSSSSSDKQSLYLQDYMKNEHLNTTSYDPVTLEGYNYLMKDVTVSQVWLCNQGILGSSGSDGTRLKHVCLSYALFHLLRRRLFGASSPEAKLQKTHDLVFRGLLSNVEEDYQAAYRVIETELAFTHDHFFTTNASLGPLIITSAVVSSKFYINELSRYSGSSNKDRYIIIAVIMWVLLALELLQLYIYLSSDFARVKLASWSITPLKGSIWSQILRVCNKLPRLFGCWQNKIGQHSLLKDLHSRTITADIMGSLLGIFAVFRPPPAFPRGIRNPGVKCPDRIPLTCRVKKAIAQTLKSSDGHLSNGTSSLERNGHTQLSEEFLLGGSHASNLLIWHIATECCEIAAQSHQTVRQVDFALHDRDVATRISSYCAYLMAFVPELLPDDALETAALFHRTRKEALQHLQKERTLEAKYTKLSRDSQSGIVIDGHSASQNGSDGQPPLENGNINDGHPASQAVKIFDKGVQLGRRLQGITDDDGIRWKILADFWTEMILYIAPSDNARDHIQHLANGGEFITHLWALLTHAGILDRGQRNVPNDKENPGDGSSYSSTSTSTSQAANQPATTGRDHSVQPTERNVRDIENSRTDQPYPKELSYGHTLRLQRVRSYCDKRAEAGTMVQQQANMVQNVEGTSNECTAPSEIEEIEEQPILGKLYYHHP